MVAVARTAANGVENRTQEEGWKKSGRVRGSASHTPVVPARAQIARKMSSSVNANAVLCVKGEIHNVLTVLRLNSRWASRERFTREIPLQAESPLARAFKGLHSHLEEVDDLANVDTVR